MELEIKPLTFVHIIKECIESLEDVGVLSNVMVHRNLKDVLKWPLNVMQLFFVKLLESSYVISESNNIKHSLNFIKEIILKQIGPVGDNCVTEEIKINFLMWIQKSLQQNKHWESLMLTFVNPLLQRLKNCDNSEKKSNKEQVIILRILYLYCSNTKNKQCKQKIVGEVRNMNNDGHLSNSLTTFKRFFFNQENLSFGSFPTSMPKKVFLRGQKKRGLKKRIKTTKKKRKGLWWSSISKTEAKLCLKEELNIFCIDNVYMYCFSLANKKKSEWTNITQDKNETKINSCWNEHYKKNFVFMCVFICGVCVFVGRIGNVPDAARDDEIAIVAVVTLAVAVEACDVQNATVAMAERPAKVKVGAEAKAEAEVRAKSKSKSDDDKRSKSRGKREKHSSRHNSRSAQRSKRSFSNERKEKTTTTTTTTTAGKNDSNPNDLGNLNRIGADENNNNNNNNNNNDNNNNNNDHNNNGNSAGPLTNPNSNQGSTLDGSNADKNVRGSHNSGNNHLSRDKQKEGEDELDRENERSRDRSHSGNHSNLPENTKRSVDGFAGLVNTFFVFCFLSFFLSLSLYVRMWLLIECHFNKEWVERDEQDKKKRREEKGKKKKKKKKKRCCGFEKALEKCE
ncbi:transcription initiation factor TFIID subunit [Reticulomyxa filosa]|uniref:Transcription initiation factor TFIID subunit n=1 Tax=Reticulomyxa filosa TaxID=46433 RepID=X6NVB7_RETFI|nr:transcription initiation factor TFIID subunit [Reticulomyxa filosa]|eukprot:ETO29227.1 transcription initiation factor TFIID subunit [Reticulomyxa filosa]